MWTPTDEDTFKLSWSTAFRRLSGQESYRQWHDRGFEDLEGEEIENTEFSYSRKINDEWKASATFYNYNQQILANNFLLGGLSSVIGETKVRGVELELEYRSGDGVIFGLSHTYSQTYDFSQKDFIAQWLTTDGLGPNSPAGTSSMLYPEHLSKIYASTPLFEDFRMDGSLQIMWCQQGMKDVVGYFNNRPEDPDYGEEYKVDRDFNDHFGPSVNLNLGLTWAMTQNQTLRFDVYNLLSAVNKDWGVLNYRGEPDYRLNPVSFALTYELKF